MIERNVNISHLTTNIHQNPRFETALMRILHQGEKYIVETKIWEGNKRYQAGKRQLAEYLKLEQVQEGYYIVFDHRLKPQARIEEEIIEGKAIISYCIPVIQEKPSAAK